VQTAISEVIEEAIYRRVQKTIGEYVKKNGSAFTENKIAGVEWNLQLTVLVDNLGLNPQPKQTRWNRLKAFLKRTLNF